MYIFHQLCSLVSLKLYAESHLNCPNYCPAERRLPKRSQLKWRRKSLEGVAPALPKATHRPTPAAGQRLPSKPARNTRYKWRRSSSSSSKGYPIPLHVHVHVHVYGLCNVQVLVHVYMYMYSSYTVLVCTCTYVTCIWIVYMYMYLY